MNTADAIAWLNELIRETESFSDRKTVGTVFVDPYEAVHVWLAKSEAAVRSILPPQHTLLMRWDRTINDGNSSTNVKQVRALLRASCELLGSARLASLLDGVRCETVVEVLDQADELNRGRPTAPVAAAVLAGGALETHLRHLCERGDPGRADTVWNEHGAIEKYKAALDRMRKGGNEIITKGDAKQVTAWADDRNLAAHDPTQFSKGAEAVQLMIDGIRQFVARTSST